MVATFRGVDWGGQAGPFKRVNVRSHPSAPARWEWGDRCRHSVKRSGRTVQLTAVRETSRNDGRWRCWDGGLQTPENSSFGYFTDFIFILQILIFILQILFCSFYFTDFILLYRFHFLFYRFYFTDFIFILQILFLFYRFYFAVFILQILFYILFTDFILYFTDFILQIYFYFSFYFKDYNWHWAALQWIFSNNNNKIRKKSVVSSSFNFCWLKASLQLKMV